MPEIGDVIRTYTVDQMVGRHRVITTVQIIYDPEVFQQAIDTMVRSALRHLPEILRHVPPAE